MDPKKQLMQIPSPGTRLVKFCGDTVEFTLNLPYSQNGTAWVRTNIGQGKVIRKEIIDHVQTGQTPLGRAWFDIPMRRIDERTFVVKLPLCEVGHFEAKCFFLSENETMPSWPPGPNTAINVDSADACCANIIYNAFVRQFGPSKAAAKSLSPSQEQLIDHLDQTGYTVIPQSGTFRDVITELDFILGELGCRILMLLPIHPTPTTYGRMGRFGSPYAALSFSAVDPALAVFDPHATPLEQFIELVDAVHQRNARLFIDIAINHTGWAAGLHESHPHWLVRNPEGKIEVPGAWGVRWEDLTKLDYTHKDLWQYMADVFLTWCNRGVDGFRCDAGYMIPQAAWKYMVARVRDHYPDTVFLLEGLGGKIPVTRDLLNTAGLNWAYSELFQSYDRGQIEKYLPEASDISQSDGITVHFAETHDNLRLASRSQVYARMRTALCALTSLEGAFGFANGVEWYATQKINVHNSPSLNWGATPNQVEFIRRLNDLLIIHPAFHAETKMQMIQEGPGNHITLLRYHQPTGKKLLVVVNLDDENRTSAGWNRASAGMNGPNFFDLLSGETVTVSRSANLDSCPLEPGQVRCLTQDENDMNAVQKLPNQAFDLPTPIKIQHLHAKALEVFTFYRGTVDLAEFDVADAGQQLRRDPVNFCRDLNPDSRESRVITWQWPQDRRREVMVPPGHFLYVQADRAFRARLIHQGRTIACEKSIERMDGSFFALFAPIDPPERPQSYTLELSVYTPGSGQHAKAPILMLPKVEHTRTRRIFARSELIENDLAFLATNGRGAMLKIPVSWGTLNSRYDCLLAGNLSCEFPEDRWIMFTRCRGWLVFQGYSQDLNSNCLETFGIDDAGRGFWRFHIPAGQGQNILVTTGLNLVPGANALQMTFYRHPSEGKHDRLEDNKAVQLILRPDIENRNFHHTTKAYTGPEGQWPQKLIPTQQGFRFSPDAWHHLRILISEGRFVWEPDWQYMVYRSREAERGQDPNSDLFSPGYFSASLRGNQQVCLSAEIGVTAEPDSMKIQPPAENNCAPFFSETNIWRRPEKILSRALDDFTVQRGAFKTVIAGYPWFLDWGRDALIFVRGLIAARKIAEARAIIRQFGQFEQQGTLPNMIHGNEAANRDTSDGPLWLIVACDELVRAEKSDDFLETDCNGRSIRRILLSIGQAIVAGTPNGIRMDPSTGLVFSPAHFTWMDTNFPAGTPRQGYPIEIQALWHAALRSLAKVDCVENQDNWHQIAWQVRTSISTLFRLKNRDYLSDCLHASAGQSALEAIADDALRPNQLLAITLGAISDKNTCRRILASCEELLVPGAIRSLADRPVVYPIEIIHQGHIINDPLNPYQGQYCGDENTRRKPAYHNGTVWSWLFPSFCEAWSVTYGKKSRETALALLASANRFLEQGCVGHVPEILDGDFPHTSRGCEAQAWGASELLRVWLKLKEI
jgi:starch synthase (maltosyl-transferring)